MIAGVSGELISHAFLEQELLPALDVDAEFARFERQLGRWSRHVARSLGPASSVRSIHDIAVGPLLGLLGHSRPALAPHPSGLCGELGSSGVMCLTVPWAVPARTAWRAALAAGVAARTPWALVSNGHSLRIVDCSRAWTRHGIEFDLDAIRSPAAAKALWLLANARAFSSGPVSLKALIDRSDAHAVSVCTSLGDGVLAALPQLASALSNGAGAHALSAMEQALTVVYRILFLLFAEARGTMPKWNEIYREAYSIDGLAQRALHGRARGLWAALQAISRLAHAGCSAGDLRVTAFNGRLFSPRHAPLIERRRVSDGLASEVLLALATEQTRTGRRRISYYDLGVEQLGSVYERVLEHEPVVGKGRTIHLSRTSTERKATGSFYTPRSITEFVVRKTLAPLTEDKTAEDILQLRIVDPAMGSGAFLVAACHYLADQCEQANVRDGRWSATDVHQRDRATLRRHVAERCLFGVDLNSTAVQLARLSLWLTTLAGERPLTFLDHHLAVGNSLVGARLADLAHPVGPRRRPVVTPLPLFEDQLTGAVAHRILPRRLQIADTPSDSIENVRTKERLLAELGAQDGPISKWSAAADAWCAAALSPSRPRAGLVAELIAAAMGSTTTLPPAQLEKLMREARQLAADHGALHWELMFPEVFFDRNGRLRADGGFDAVVSNPPWDMLRADTGSDTDRAASRSSTAAALRFYRGSGSYRLQSRGHANRYQLFLERALQLARPGGRVGLILPSGIATDHGSADLRRHLFTRTSIDTWLGFDNRHRIFPIHRSMRFVLMSTTMGGETSALNFRCGLTDPRLVDGEMQSAALTVSRSRIEAWSADLSIPELPDATALAIVSGVSARIPALSDGAGWNVRFGRELNATDDRPHFVPLAASRSMLLPIVEGKLLSPFQVDTGRAACGVPIEVAERLLDRRPFERPRLAYRDVASSTNKLTLIAAMLPAGTVSTHTVFVAKSVIDDDAQWCLLGLLNSLVANYLIRVRVSTHVTTAAMARLQVPKPPVGSRPFTQLVSLSRVLCAKGIDHASAEYAQLNALAARLYGLDFAQFEYVTRTFPLIDAGVRSRSLEQFAAT